LSYNQILSGSLKSKFKFLLKDSAIYGIAGAFNQLIKIFTVPFVARFYTKEEFGSNDLLNTLLFLTVPFIFFGLDSSIGRFYFEYDDEQKKKELVFFCFISGIVFSLLCMVFLKGFEAQICSGFLKVTDVKNSFNIIVLTIPFMYISSFFTNLFKYNFNRRDYLIQNVGGGFITVFLTFVFVVVFKFTIVWTLIAHLISRILMSAIALFKTNSLMYPNFHFEDVKPAILFALPFMFTSVLGIWIPSMDRFVMSNYLGVSYVATYVLGQRITGMMSLPYKSFQTSWGPFSMALYKDKSASDTYSKTLLYSTLALCIFAIGIIGLQQPLVLLFGSAKYATATSVIPLLSLFVVIQNMLGICSTGISLAKKSQYYIFGYLISIAVSYSFMRLLLIPFDICGVASGMLIGQFVNMLILHQISLKIFPTIQVKLRNPLIIFGFTVVFALLMTKFYYIAWWLELLFSFIMCVFILSYFYIFSMENNEKKYVAGFFLKYRRDY
jgi:O-antigen/teichoic acid export membrane protein